MSLPRFKSHRKSIGKELNLLLDYLLGSLPEIFGTEQVVTNLPTIPPFVASITGDAGIVASPLTGDVHLSATGAGSTVSPYAAKVYRNTAGSTNIWSGTGVKVGYTTVESDPDSAFSGGTYHVLVTGCYLIIVRSSLQPVRSNVQIYHRIGVAVNGSEEVVLDSSFGVDTELSTGFFNLRPLFGFTVMQLTAGMTVDIHLQILGGASVNGPDSLGPYGEYFQITRLA